MAGQVNIQNYPRVAGQSSPQTEFGLVDQMTAELYQDVLPGFTSFIKPTGVASTDMTALGVALALLANNAVVLPGQSSFSMMGGIFILPGALSITGTINLPNDRKYQGLSISGGAGLGNGGGTIINYVPATSQPLFINQKCLGMTWQNMSFNCTDAANGSWFMYDQEQAGISNIQGNTYVNLGYKGFEGLHRKTGGNNNSEDRFVNNGAASCGPWVYSPAQTTCSISPGQDITITNAGQSDLVVGDTGHFTSLISPVSSTSTQYYVVQVTPTTFRVSATSGGTPITFTASGTTNFQNGSDQFLNYSFIGITKHWNATGPFIQMSFGGGIQIDYLEASAFAPTSPCAFVGSCSGTTLTVTSTTGGAVLVPGQVFEGTGGTVLPGTRVVSILTGTGGAGSTVQVNLSQTIAGGTSMFVTVPLIELLVGAHNAGAQTFTCNKGRVEYQNDVGRALYSEWVGGAAINVSCWDESSQVGNRAATNYNFIFNITNNASPVIQVNGSLLAGQNAIVTNTNNFNFTQSMWYRSNTLLQAGDVGGVTSPFMLWGKSAADPNTGGAPVVHFRGTQQRNSASGTTKPLLDCDWNWSLAEGGMTEEFCANLVGVSSGLPLSLANGQQFRLPYNSRAVRGSVCKPSGGLGGAYGYKVVNLDGYVFYAFEGADASQPINADFNLNLALNSDTARTIFLVETAGRSTTLNGTSADFTYKGG